MSTTAPRSTSTTTRSAGRPRHVALRTSTLDTRAKRVLDVTVAGTLLALLLPLMGVLAVLVLLSGPGPALFVQTRVGRDGRPFRLLKLRTMRVGAHVEASLLRRGHHDGSGPLFKLRDDPRVTGVGRFLRRSSLDELPQLVNVLRGEMSLVGPRPALPEEVARYSPQARRRLQVKPGLTGPWQVSGRSRLTWERAVELDLEYVERGTLATDLWILLRTVPAVLLGRGAY